MPIETVGSLDDGTDIIDVTFKPKMNTNKPVTKRMTVQYYFDHFMGDFDHVHTFKILSKED